MPDLDLVGIQLIARMSGKLKNHLTSVISLRLCRQPSCLDQPFDNSPNRGMAQTEPVAHRLLRHLQALMLIQVIDHDKLGTSQIGKDAPHALIHVLFQQGVGYFDQPLWPLLREFQKIPPL